MARAAWRPRRLDADLVVVNTCSVTARPIKARGRSSERSRAKIRPPRIVVTGCYATRRPDEVAGLPGVVQIVPNDRKEHLAHEIGLTTAERFGDGEGACGAEIAPGVGRAHRVHASCADRLRSDVLRIASFRRRAGAAAAGPMHEVLSEIDRVAMRAIERSRSPACILVRTAAISATGRRCWSC